MRHTKGGDILGAAVLICFPFLLSACAKPAPPERTILVSQCVKDGNTEEACRCMADKAEATLDKEVLAAMALAAEGKDDEADEAMRKLTMEQQFSVAPFAAAAVEACNLS